MKLVLILLYKSLSRETLQLLTNELRHYMC